MKGRKKRKDDGHEMTMECPVHARCFHSEYSVYFSRTTRGFFLFKRSKETPREFLVALQYYCGQITALMLTVINRKLKKLIEGLPWWLSGKVSACQCMGHGFNP